MDFYREIIKKYGLFFDNLDNEITFECFSILRVYNNQFTYTKTINKDIYIKNHNYEYICKIDISDEGFLLSIFPTNENKPTICDLTIVSRKLQYDKQTRILTVEEIDNANSFLRIQKMKFNKKSSSFYINQIKLYKQNKILSLLNNLEFDLLTLNNKIKPQFSKELLISRNKPQTISINFLIPNNYEKQFNNSSNQYSYYLKAIGFINEEMSKDSDKLKIFQKKK